MFISEGTTVFGTVEQMVADIPKQSRVGCTASLSSFARHGTIAPFQKIVSDQ